MTTPSYLISDNSIVLFYDNAPHTIVSSHPQWSKALDYIRNGRWDDFVTLATPVKPLSKYLTEDRRFTIENDEIFYHGEKLPDFFAKRLFSLMEHNLPTNALTNFITRLYDNPDSQVVEHLLSFLDRGNLPITPEGRFLAYKLVRDNYTDVHSGTVDYSMGKIVEMPRRKVDSDRSITCSFGLHACSLEYLAHFNGDRLIVVEIDPADVVAIPADYNDTKLRCAKMRVVAELDRALVKPAWNTPIYSYDNVEEEEEEEEKEEEGNPTYWTIEHSNGNQFWDHDDKRWAPLAYLSTRYYTLESALNDRDALRLLGHDCGVYMH
jgi:hypothetical protein